MWRHRSLAVIAASLILITSQAWGQQSIHRVGVLASTELHESTQAFVEELRERGYVVGRDLQIDYRYFKGRTEQIPALLAELVAFGPEVIVTSTSDSAVVIHAAASTIPMVFLNVAVPVALGLVRSLAHPGGNVTGFATFVPEGIIGKHLQFLKELVPQASRIAVLVNTTAKMHQLALQRLREAGELLGLQFVVVEASEPDQFATAFEQAHRQGAEAIDVWNGPLVFRHSAEIARLAADYRLPAMYYQRSYVLDGGLRRALPRTLPPSVAPEVWTARLITEIEPNTCENCRCDLAAKAGTDARRPGTGLRGGRGEVRCRWHRRVTIARSFLSPTSPIRALRHRVTRSLVRRLWAPSPNRSQCAVRIRYGVGHHTEDDCRPEDAFMQVYRPLYEEAYAYRNGGMFDLRPLYMFYKPAILNGNEERFAKITDPDLIVELQAIKARMYPDP